MKHHSLRLLAASGFCVLAAAQAHAFDLTVEVLNPRSLNGTVNAAVFAEGPGWLKDAQAVQAALQPVADKTVFVYRNLAAGRYGVTLFQDENRNGKLDTNPAGLPTERYGFSRDARGRMGPPAFADAAIDLQADTTISVTLR